MEKISFNSNGQWNLEKARWPNKPAKPGESMPVTEKPLSSMTPEQRTVANTPKASPKVSSGIASRQEVDEAKREAKPTKREKISQHYAYKRLENEDAPDVESHIYDKENDEADNPKRR